MGKEFFSIVDILVFFSFLSTLLMANIWGQQHTNGSVRYFAWGGKRKMKFHIYILLFLNITITGSGFFIVLERSYLDGFWGIIALIFFYPSALRIIASVYIKPLKTLSGDFPYPVLTMYEWFDRKYGLKFTNIRVLMGTAEIVSRAGLLITQFYVIGRVLAFFLCLSQQQEFIFIIIFSVIIICYSTFGGIKSLSGLNLALFLLFWGTIFITGWKLINSSSQGFLESLKTINAHPKMNFKSGFLDFNISCSTISFSLNNLFPRIYNSWFQRFVLAEEDCRKITNNDIKRTKDAFIWTNFFVFFFYCSIACTSLIIYSQNQSLSKEEIFSYFISHTPNGLKGIIGGGIIMLCLNLCEAEINAFAIVFENDIVPVLFKKRIEKQNVVLNYENIAIYDHKANKLYGAHWKNLFSFLFGIICLIGIISFFKNNFLLKIVLFFNTFYFATVPASILLTVLGYNLKVKSIILGMACGISLSLVLYFFLPKESIFFFGLFSNFLGIFLGEKFFTEEEN